MAIKKRRFFLPKKKTRKYNKFFSYKNENRIKRNFMYKNFARSNSYNTTFAGSNFSFANFEKANMKFCSFNGAYFNGTEFKNTNLRGSRFKGARFQNVLFLNTKLEKVNFESATFQNVIFINTPINKVKGISMVTSGITCYNNIPVIDIDKNIKFAIIEALKNKYIKDSEVLLIGKGQKLHYINIQRLEDKFKEDLVLGLQYAKEGINKRFFTLSYLIAFIEKELNHKEVHVFN